MGVGIDDGMDQMTGIQGRVAPQYCLEIHSAVYCAFCDIFSDPIELAPSVAS